MNNILKTKDFSLVFLSVISALGVNIFIFPFTLLAQLNSSVVDTTKVHVKSLAVLMPQGKLPGNDTTKLTQIPLAKKDTNIRYYESPDVKNTIAKVEQVEQLTHGSEPGFRIQINFGQDRSQANKLKSDFTVAYPAIPAYLIYQQPYFKVNVGDFRTRLDAARFLNTMKKNYPSAFIVKDKILPPPL